MARACCTCPIKKNVLHCIIYFLYCVTMYCVCVDVLLTELASLKDPLWRITADTRCAGFRRVGKDGSTVLERHSCYGDDNCSSSHFPHNGSEVLKRSTHRIRQAHHTHASSAGAGATKPKGVLAYGRLSPFISYWCAVTTHEYTKHLVVDIG